MIFHGYVSLPEGKSLSIRTAFPSYAVPIPMASMAGFFEVTTLEIDLMDPERVEAVQSAAWCDSVETRW